MIELIIWVLVGFGISNSIAYSNLTEPFRVFLYTKAFKGNSDPNDVSKGYLQAYKLVSCVMCLAFWVGMGLYLWKSPTGVFLLDGFLCSATSWIIFLLIKNRQETS